MIDLVNLHKSFGDLHVLRGVTFSVRKGETHVVLGRSGTGKSVSLKCIVGLLDPDEGAVLAEGVEVAQMDQTTLEAWRSRVGFLFQGGALYDSMSVLENMVFPLRSRKDLSEEDKTDLAHENSVGLVWRELSTRTLPTSRAECGNGVPSPAR